MPDKEILNWETISSGAEQNLKIFDLKIVKRRNLKIGKESDFVVLNSPKWVNIIPITKNDEVVLVEQYRHGIDQITLEVPGGLVEPGEEPRVAAERECSEETGYSSELRAEQLGENLPNPAFLTNTCYSFLWRDCELTSMQKLDGNEDIAVHLLPMKDIKNKILDGTIRHSLVLTAFFFYSLKYGL